jgi:hypothetical protein
MPTANSTPPTPATADWNAGRVASVIKRTTTTAPRRRCPEPIALLAAEADSIRLLHGHGLHDQLVVPA